MDRKEFIKSCGYACMGGAVLSLFLESCASTNYFAQSTFSNQLITVKKTEFIKTEKDKIIQRKFILIKNEKFTYPICVYKLAEDNFSALLMQCTHNGCELQPQGDFMVCPCHGSEFSNTGVVLNPPAEQNLQSFKVTIDHENIYIHI